MPGNFTGVNACALGGRAFSPQMPLPLRITTRLALWKPVCDRFHFKMQELSQIRSVASLIEFIAQGYTPNYVFFWGHTPKVPGDIDKSCLSNWYPADFEVAGVLYPTTEHHMMAEKARLFGDTAIRDQIVEAKSPDKAKALGRQVADFDAAEWNKNRFEIVVYGNFAKFSQNKELGELLLRTGSKVLVEASPQDRIWGIGLAQDSKDAANPANWNGLNLLGFALMEVRARLQADY